MKKHVLFDTKALGSLIVERGRERERMEDNVYICLSYIIQNTVPISNLNKCYVYLKFL